MQSREAQSLLDAINNNPEARRNAGGLVTFLEGQVAPASAGEEVTLGSARALQVCIDQMREHASNRGVNLNDYNGQQILESIQRRIQRTAQ